MSRMPQSNIKENINNIQLLNSLSNDKVNILDTLSERLDAVENDIEEYSLKNATEITEVDNQAYIYLEDTDKTIKKAKVEDIITEREKSSSNKSDTALTLSVFFYAGESEPENE